MHIGWSRTSLLLLAVLLTLATMALADNVIEDGLISYWSFDKDTILGEQAQDIWGEQHATILGNIENVPGKVAEAMEFGGSAGTRLDIADNADSAPMEAMTVELWVWDERFVEWGGYIGAFQDNGGFEKGWLLGTRNAPFTFALSTEGADDGDGVLTYLNTLNNYDKAAWHHVAATYDGKVMSIYVNSELEGTSEVQSGAINYPDEVFFSIGSYKDDNEDFVLAGKLDEVRLYSRALSQEELRHNMTASGLAVEAGSKLVLTWGRLKGGMGN